MVKAATKTCSKCHECKPVDLFRKKHNQCKACIAAKKREYRQKNKEKIAANHREYRQENKEEIAAQQRKYYQEHKEEIIARQREYRQEHKEVLNARIRKRRKNDPEYNLICRLRGRMYAAVKAAGLDKKCDSSSELLGISYQGLKEWLEAQFTEGMTWENRSDWHVDHRVPCDAFDMSVETNQRICFWYKNLQPMWANDNMEKSNKYNEEEKQALISAYYNQ
jgi:gas vesicle protein